MMSELIVHILRCENRIIVRENALIVWIHVINISGSNIMKSANYFQVHLLPFILESLSVFLLRSYLYFSLYLTFTIIKTLVMIFYNTCSPSRNRHALWVGT